MRGLSTSAIEDCKDVPVEYDTLGSSRNRSYTYSYFGHDEFAEFAPGLKGLADGVRIRNKVLECV